MKARGATSTYESRYESRQFGKGATEARTDRYLRWFDNFIRVLIVIALCMATDDLFFQKSSDSANHYEYISFDDKKITWL